jgi:hypothetical protein
MAVSPNSIITPQRPMSRHANLTAATALTSRAPIAGVGGLTALITTGQNTDGVQINSIKVKGASNAQSATTPLVVYVWQYDGTTSWLVDEIVVTAVTPSTTAASFQTQTYYNGWIMAAGHGLYVSSSVTTVVSTSAVIVQVLGGEL